MSHLLCLSKGKGKASTSGSISTFEIPYWDSGAGAIVSTSERLARQIPRYYSISSDSRFQSTVFQRCAGISSVMERYRSFENLQRQVVDIFSFLTSEVTTCEIWPTLVVASVYERLRWRNCSYTDTSLCATGNILKL